MNKKNLIFLLIAAASASFSSSDALAITALRQVQVSNGSQVDLLFDGKLSRSQIKTEFFNDIIQISLSDVSVYPAKISSVNGGSLTKVFAYQYSPRLVRCRLTVNGKAESYKDKFNLSTGGPNGRMLTIHLEAGQKAAKPQSKEDADEAALLERVMRSPAPQSASVTPQQKAPEKADEKISDKIVENAAAPIAPAGGSYSDSESKPIHLSKPDSRSLGGANNAIPSPLGVFGKLALVVGLFSLTALGLKKLWKNPSKGDNAIIGAIGKFARSKLGVKGSTAGLSIDIVANHHLGPKKSIAVVRVGGRTLVIGITEQSINLISQLSSEEDAMNSLVELDNPPLDGLSPKPGIGATVAGPAVFSKVLQSEAAKPSVNPPIVKAPRTDVRVTSYGNPVANPGVSTMSAQAAIGLSGVRAQIKSKLEGLKQI